MKDDFESRRLFISDTILRAFENVDNIYDHLGGCGIEEDFFHFLIHSHNINLISDILEPVYQSVHSNIVNNVTMRYGGINFDTILVDFHEQFGWVVTSEIGKAYLGKIILTKSLPVSIGLMSYFSGCSRVRGRDTLEVGSFSSLASNMHITTSSYSHPTHFPSTFNFNGNARVLAEAMNFDISFQDRKPVKNGVFIGSDVWVGRDVSIKNGVNIGHGCVIGERALVTKDCEPYGIYGGVPARLIRYRFSKDVIVQLLELAWWNWPYKKIVSNKRFFDTDLVTYNGSLKQLVV